MFDIFLTYNRGKKQVTLRYYHFEFTFDENSVISGTNFEKKRLECLAITILALIDSRFYLTRV